MAILHSTLALPASCRRTSRPAAGGTVRTLLDAGASVHARSEKGETPLMRVVLEHDDIEMAKLLIDAGAVPRIARGAVTGLDSVLVHSQN